MDLSRNKLVNAVFIVVAIVISLIVTARIYFWLVSLNANTSLKITIPIVIFFACVVGLWVVYSYLRIFIFQQRRVKGYQLRGKITFYFLVISIGSIALVGSLMVYLIFLIENSFIEGEKDIAEVLIDDYKHLIDMNKTEFEVSVRDMLEKSPQSFTLIFELKGDKAYFVKASDKSLTNDVSDAVQQIDSFFTENPNDIYYLYSDRNMVIVQHGAYYYAQAVPVDLNRSFEILNQNVNKYYQFNALKQHIRPISVVSLVIFSIPILAVAFFISLFVARAITTNIEEIAKGTKIVAEGNLDYKVRIHTKDEIEDLAENFNKMAYRLKITSEQVKRMERLEAWQEVARRLAHEIKNPLTPIKLSAERVLYAFENKREDFENILKKTANTIIKETNRLETLVNEFSSFARLPNLKLEQKDIIATLKDVADFFRNGYPDVTIDYVVAEKKYIMDFDENQLKQVLINLIRNAIEACHDGQKYVKMFTLNESDSFTIGIADRSGGIPPEAADKLFEPYFTTKENGTGLGLAIAERIVIEHGGNLWYEDIEGGSVFFIELPRSLRGGNLEE